MHELAAGQQAGQQNEGGGFARAVAAGQEVAGFNGLFASLLEHELNQPFT